MEIEEKRSQGLASWCFYGDWSTGRLIFSQGRSIFCCVHSQHPLLRQHIHITIYPHPPLAHLSSQVGQAHWGPWGGETKIIIGPSLSLTVHPTFDLFFGGRQQQRRLLNQQSSNERPPKAWGPLGQAATASSSVGGANDIDWINDCLLYVIIFSALIGLEKYFRWHSTEIRSLHCGDSWSEPIVCRFSSTSWAGFVCKICSTLQLSHVYKSLQFSANFGGNFTVEGFLFLLVFRHRYHAWICQMCAIEIMQHLIQTTPSTIFKWAWLSHARW